MTLLVGVALSGLGRKGGTPTASDICTAWRVLKSTTGLTAVSHSRLVRDSIIHSSLFEKTMYQDPLYSTARDKQPNKYSI